MSKEEEHDVLGQLESVVNDAFSGIKSEWQALQMRLMQESRKMSAEVLETDSNMKAILCVGSIITKSEFDSDDDNVEKVGPAMEEYIGVGTGSPVHARMQPAVGVKTANDMLKFLSDKALVCSLYEATDYVSLLMHVKFKNSTLVAMSSPNGVAVSLERTDKPDHSAYLMFDGEQEKAVKQALGVLTDRQREMIMHLCEAQLVAPKMKATQPKIWALMIEAIKEHNPNGFLNTEGGDE